MQGGQGVRSKQSEIHFNYHHRSVLMKTALAAILAVSLSLSMAARSAQTAPAPSPRADLAAMLTDADHAVSTTNTDLASLNIEKWSSGWKSGFTKKSSHKKDAQQAADSVKQLSAALPAMIADVRSSHGNVGSTFKLYNGLTQACENLDSLVEATQAYGKKDEYTRLSADYNNLLHVRNSLSTYVEQRAAVVDPKGVQEASAVSVKKTEKPSHTRKTAARKTTVRKKKVVLRSSR